MRGSVRVWGYGARDMPHWIALFAIVVAAWMAVAVVGGWLIGRGLGLLERRDDESDGAEDARSRDEGDLRRAA